MSTRKWHKRCFVPGCSSNSSDQPSKPFIKLPPGSAIRKKWAEAVGRKGKEVHFNAVSGIYCCGDHFNLEEDAQNWMRYKIMGGSIKLKPEILPQISKRENKDPLLLNKPSKTEQMGQEYDRLISDNRPCSHIAVHNIEIKHESLSDDIVKTEPTTKFLVEETFFQAVPDVDSQMFLDSSKTELEDPFSDEMSQDTKRSRNRSFSHKDIQCNINTRKHVRSKATQVNMNILTCSRATSPITFKKRKKN